MKIHLKTVWQWSDERKQYVKVSDESFEYIGPISMACGATGAQNQILQSQQTFMNQAQSQASTVFGNASQVFQSLVSTFTPTIKAGVNQQGFSPAELAARNSAAITNVGQQYANAKAAVGNAQASVGGGNTTLPSGVNEATNAALAGGAANETSNELNQITQENYATGRQNYENAVKGMEGATSVYNPAVSATNAATGAGEAASDTANKIASQQNSWMNLVGGALSAAAGAASGGLTNSFTHSPAGVVSGSSSLPQVSGSADSANY
jgi:hypothetical protein